MNQQQDIHTDPLQRCLLAVAIPEGYPVFFAKEITTMISVINVLSCLTERRGLVSKEDVLFV